MNNEIARARFYLNNVDNFLSERSFDDCRYRFLRQMCDIVGNMMCMCVDSVSLVNVVKSFISGHHLFHKVFQSYNCYSSPIHSILANAFAAIDNVDIGVIQVLRSNHCCCKGATDNLNSGYSCGCSSNDTSINTEMVDRIVSIYERAFSKLVQGWQHTASLQTSAAHVTILLLLQGLKMQQYRIEQQLMLATPTFNTSHKCDGMNDYAQDDKDENDFMIQTADRIASILSSFDQTVEYLLPITALPIALSADVHIQLLNAEEKRSTIINQLKVEASALHSLSKKYPIVAARFDSTVDKIEQAISEAHKRFEREELPPLLSISYKFDTTLNNFNSIIRRSPQQQSPEKDQEDSQVYELLSKQDKSFDDINMALSPIHTVEETNSTEYYLDDDDVDEFFSDTAW